MFFIKNACSSSGYKRKSYENPAQAIYMGKESLPHIGSSDS